MPRQPPPGLAERKQALLDLLTGSRLGPHELSQLGEFESRVQSLSRVRDQVSPDFASELERMLKVSLELRTGATCKHGGDQGPNCRLCMARGARLQGPFVSSPPGLDWADYETRQIEELQGGKELIKVRMHLDRVGRVLDDADVALKAALQECKVKAEKRRTAALKTTAADAGGQEVSIDRIKVASGVNPVLLAQACDLAQSETAKRASPRTVEILVGDLLIDNYASKPLPESIITVADLAEHLSSLVLAKSGRELIRPVFFKHRKNNAVLEPNDSIDDFDIKLSLTVVNPLAMHLAPLECYQRRCVSREQSSSLAVQLAKSTPLIIAVEYTLMDKPVAFFSSISYSFALEDLRLRGNARLDVSLLIAALRTLPNLKSLDLSHSCQSCGLLPLLSFFNESALALESLDLSGWSFCRSLSDSSLPHAFDQSATKTTCSALSAAIHSMPQLSRLSLNACFHTADAPSSDVVCDELYGLLLSLGGRVFRRLGFAGNKLFNSASLRSMVTWMIQRSIALDLSGLVISEATALTAASPGLWLTSALSSASKLSELCLSGCPLGDQGAEALALALANHRLPDLRVLRIAACGLTEAHLDRVFQAPAQLDELDLAFNPGALPSSSSSSSRTRSPLPLQVHRLCMATSQGSGEETIARFFGLQRVDVFDEETARWRTITRG